MIINGERALAYIVRVDNITEIAGADNIENAVVGGWNVIVKKREFQPGDKAVFFEIDSKLPESDERFKFLESKHYKIKTMKLGKFNAYSQGLLMPLSGFPELGDPDINTDVTKTLGVVYSVAEDNVRKAPRDPNAKYKSMGARHPKLFRLKPVRWLMKRKWGRAFLFALLGRKKDKPLSFPDFVKKTDEERVENMPWVLGNGKPYVITEKCLSGRMLVRTDDGYHRLSEIVNNRLPVNVATFNHDTKMIEYQPIREYHRIKQDDKPCYRIGIGHRGKGNRPKYIECTADHKLFVNGKWTCANEVNVGDWVSHYSEELPTEAFEMILGSLLGDATINHHGEYINIGFTHSEKQFDYLSYKKRILGKYANDNQERVSGYGSAMHGFCTKSNLFVDSYVALHCISDGKKRVTKQWCDDLTPISLAFWYMDDGTIVNRTNLSVGDRISFATNAFSDDECRLLQDMLLSRFGIESELHQKESYKGNVISLGVEATRKFCSLIAPYVCASMKYKLPLKYEDMPCVFEGYSPIYTCGVVNSQVISVEECQPKAFGGYMFDITTDNHNYFAQGVLVHNCDGTSCTYALRRKGKKKYEFFVCSRNVRQMSQDQKTYHDHNIYWDMAFKYDIERHLREYLEENPKYEWVYVQGEGVGSVQGNPLRLKEDDLYLFNFVTPDGRLGSLEGRRIAEDRWNMKWVPILDIDATRGTMEETKEYADGFSKLNPNVLREGLVYRGLDGAESFKNVSRKYLLKKKE